MTFQPQPARPPRLARVPPQNLDAEESVLGAMMISGKAVEAVLELGLEPDCFYRESHGHIFQVCSDLYRDDKPVDAITVSHELERRHQLAPIGGPEKIQELASLVPAAANAAHYARIVREMWGKRQLIQAFTAPMQGAWNGKAPTDVLADVERACIDMHSLIVDENTTRVVTALQAAEAAQNRILGSDADATGKGGVKPPFRFLDDLSGGGLYVLGGYPKDGKSDVGIECWRQGCESGARVGFVSIEMPEKELTNRLLATFGIPYAGLRRNHVDPPHMDRFREAVGTVGCWDYEILDDPAADVADIVRFQRLGHFDLLVIDHLHRMSYEEAYNPRLALSGKVKSIAKLARQADIPVVLLAQLHRASSPSNPFPMPTMQSFAETATIEREATELWSIYRKRDPETGERTNASVFSVLASRYGEDKTRNLMFNGNHQRFTETDWRHQ